MDAHERAAVEKRLSEVTTAIAAIPKNAPRPAIVNRWLALLEEQEQLEEQLNGSSIRDEPMQAATAARH